MECHDIALYLLDLMVFEYLHAVLDNVMVCTEFPGDDIAVFEFKCNIFSIVILYCQTHPTSFRQTCSICNLHRECSLRCVLCHRNIDLVAKSAVVLEINHQRRTIQHGSVGRKVLVLHYKCGLVPACSPENEVSCPDLDGAAVYLAV